MAKFTTLSAIVLLALSACSDFNAVESSKAAAAGAAVGAGANYLAGESVTTGAAVGAVGGVIIDEVLN